jgi:hypothetical protein
MCHWMQHAMKRFDASGKERRPWRISAADLPCRTCGLNPHFSYHFSIVDLMPEAQAFWWLPRNMLLV